MTRSVLQDWVQDLTFMQQSVLLCALRGPDGLCKNHISKKLIRWLRRCILFSAFDNAVLTLPWDVTERKGGSFTGPSVEFDPQRWACWQDAMNDVVDKYMLLLDGVPHHFQLHFLHAAEIIGYCHPDSVIRAWWCGTYGRLCNDMHLLPEPAYLMNRRLGDNEQAWRYFEEVRAD